MKELIKMANELDNLYNLKEIELNVCQNTPNAYVRGELINRKNDIEFFKSCILDVTKDPTLKNQIIKNFTKDMEKIKAGIEKIKCE